MFKKLTPVGRLTAIVLIVAALGGGVWALLKNNPNIAESLGADGKYDATIIVDTYTGWAPIVWGNGGKEGTKDSYFSQKFGLRLKIIQMDDFEACRAALRNGEADMAFCTLDSYPVEMSASGDMTDMKYFMIHNFSAGADAIVVTRNITTVADLKGKKVAYSEGTASHSLLLNVLETSGLTGNDIELVKTGYGSDVAQAFKARQVDAAVVFTPDDDDCVAAVPGAHILTSTASSNTIVTDGFIAKKDWIAKHEDIARKFTEAMLWANSEYTYNENSYNEACKVFAEAFEIDPEYVMSTGKKIKFATLADNVNWFGLNTAYTGTKGETLYTKMAHTYASLGLTKNPLPWTKVSYTGVVEYLMENNNLTNNQEENGTKQKKFTAPTKAMETTAALSNKKVVINFATNSSTLDDNARCTIDNEFAGIAAQFSNMRVRVEGNCDAVGNYEYNITLSKKRAQAVVDYLVKEYNMDPNRFITVGNGSKKAIADGVTGASEAYRTTDFQLISE